MCNLRFFYLLPLLLTSCAKDPVPGAYQAAIRAQGYVAYNQPTGDPRNINDWNKLGPGTILRSAGKTHYFPAKTLIGEEGVKKAMEPAHASPIDLFSNRKVSGYDFDGKGGWTLDAVNQIAASLDVKKVTDVEIKFGKAWLANALSEGELHQAIARSPDLDAVTKRALMKKQFVVVQNAVFTESVRYTFKQSTEAGASATYKLTAQEIAALQAKGFSVIDGGVDVSEPRFIAFTPVPDVADDVKRK